MTLECYLWLAVVALGLWALCDLVEFDDDGEE